MHKIIAIDVGVRNLALCVYKDGFEKLINIDITKGKITNINKAPVKNLIDHLISSFASIEHLFEEIDVVIIEQQLSKSIKMTSIMWSLYTLIKPKCKNVILQPAYKKNDILRCQRGRSYQQTKRLGVQMVSDFMQSQDEFKFSTDVVDFFESSNKKDDLADSIIHLIVYIRGLS